MRILSINLLAMSEKMRSRESHGSIDPVGVMRQVQNSLRSLLWSVRSNSAEFATAVAVVLTGSGSAMAQERPAWSRPDQVVAAMTVPASPWAPIARPTETAVVDVTSDGRKFADLKEKDVDVLTDIDFKRYRKWELAQKNARITELDKEQAQIDEARRAQQTLQTLVASYKANWSLNPSERQQAIQALRNPMIPAELRANLRKVFGINENV